MAQTTSPTDPEVWSVPEQAPVTREYDNALRQKPAARHADPESASPGQPAAQAVAKAGGRNWFKVSEFLVLVVAIGVLALGWSTHAPVWLHYTLLAFGALLLGLAFVLLAGWWRRAFLVRLVLHASETIVESVQRPITLAVLDEVAEVLSAARYTQSLAAALEENEAELRTMIREKIDGDRVTGRFAAVPFADRVVDLTTDTTLRVILAILADPRTDELFSDVVRDGVKQVRAAVYEHDR